MWPCDYAAEWLCGSYSCNTLPLNIPTPIPEPDRAGPPVRRALLARGTKAAGIGSARFLTMSGRAFSYKAMLLSVLKAQIEPKWPPRVPPRCQNGFPECQNGDTKPPKWQSREAKKGLAAEGVALKIYMYKLILIIEPYNTPKYSNK